MTMQEHGDLIVSGISGSFSNVVGLPVERVGGELDTLQNESRKTRPAAVAEP